MKHAIHFLSFALLAGVFCFAAQAVDLETARKEKTITELPSGYVQSNTPATKSLADEVNAKRKQAYEEIAKKNGLALEAVAAQAAKKIQEKSK